MNIYLYKYLLHKYLVFILYPLIIGGLMVTGNKMVYEAMIRRHGEVNNPYFMPESLMFENMWKDGKRVGATVWSYGTQLAYEQTWTLSPDDKDRMMNELPRTTESVNSIIERFKQGDFSNFTPGVYWDEETQKVVFYCSSIYQYDNHMKPLRNTLIKGDLGFYPRGTPVTESGDGWMVEYFNSDQDTNFSEYPLAIAITITGS